MTHKSTRLVLGTSLLASLLAPAPALADAAYLDRFEGGWRGEGFVQREQDSEPRSVSCSVDGARPSENALAISGSCRAAVIFTREIGADIRYDPGSDTFAGTYTGSTRGPAQLSGGRLDGDALVLQLTYPTVVHGDRSAVMTIRNAGGGSFNLSVTDQVGGAARKTSDITLNGG